MNESSNECVSGAACSTFCIGDRVMHCYRSPYWPPEATKSDDRLHGVVIGYGSGGQIKCRWDNGDESMTLPCNLGYESNTDSPSK